MTGPPRGSGGGGESVNRLCRACLSAHDWGQALQDLAFVSLFSSKESAACAISASSAARSGVMFDVSDFAWVC